MKRGRALAGRVGVSLGLLLFGALAAASGVDRMSLLAPALGRLVPGPLQAQAARSTAALAITRGQSEAAIAAARKAVAADPVDPASTALLGTAYLLTEQPAEAEAFVGPGVTMADGAVLAARGALFEDAAMMGIYRGNPAALVGERRFEER